MKITRDTAVTLNYRITDLKGKPLDAGATAYLHGGYEGLFPKAEQELEGKEVGASVTLDLQPNDAFGERDESLVRILAKTDFPPGVKVGGQLQGPGPDGQARLFNVVKIKGAEVHLDANHALAGQAIRFSATVKEVRAATAEEITHRHVHGAHGHHH
ncbi:FKBP-type peptidyl-prolyl cis-trans isomerase [Ottowia thiooxydans]|uniref:FKBP-type peptidyl-prolyl cis-trans isomerase n=1 Tax=Ottowia thiooxydans TaxID=219182 RepID=UPI000415AF86|nr:peptidylprolyl isomerase [Ottowia thiooxydans]